MERRRLAGILFKSTRLSAILVAGEGAGAP